MKLRLGCVGIAFVSLVLSMTAQTTSGNAGTTTTPSATTAAVVTTAQGDHPLSITGSGTTNYVPLWTNASNLTGSAIYQDPVHGYIGIGNTSPAASLDVENNSFFPIIGSTNNGALPAITGLNLSTAGSAPGVGGTTSSAAGIGVFGNANSTSGAAFGVEGTTTTPEGAGVYGFVNGSNAEGVAGVNQATTGTATGVLGSSVGGYGVYGVCGPSTSSPCTGVYAISKSTSGTTNGLVAVTNSPAGAAGYFINNAGGLILLGVTSNGGNAKFYVDGDGNGYFAGTLTKGGGSFKIDDPLDPENKYLSHSFVESPDMMNIYNGTARFNARGEVWVTMPDYFQALNRDFQYVLTALGRPQPYLYIAMKMKGNRFKIAGGKPNAEVSWQVTGVRHDAWANAHRIPVEEDKPEKERGTYLHPELFGSDTGRRVSAQLVPRPLGSKAEQK